MSPNAVSMDRVLLYSGALYVKNLMFDQVKEAFPNAMLTEAALSLSTAKLARGCTAVVLFVNDTADRKIISALAKLGVKYIAMRCAGYDRVDLAACKDHGIRVCRVPTYSPTSVAEMAVSMMMALNRKICTTWSRVRDGNYTLSGLTGFEMRGKTALVMGTGAIGYHTCCIMKGFGCRVLGYDPYPNPKVLELGVEYVSIDEGLPQADIISLHMPLLPSTHHVADKEFFAKMKPGAMLINVSRGGLVCTDDLLEALRLGCVGSVGLDVYEGEDDIFFRDTTQHSWETRMQRWDDRFALLNSYPNVLICPHSAWFTKEAIESIAGSTVDNLRDMHQGKDGLMNEVVASDDYQPMAPHKSQARFWNAGDDDDEDAGDEPRRSLEPTKTLLNEREGQIDGGLRMGSVAAMGSLKL